MGQYHRSRLGVSQPKSVYTSRTEVRLLLIGRESWIFKHCGMISAPYPLVKTSIFYRGEPTLVFWSERLVKSPYQRNTPPTVRLEPAIYRLQIQALTELSWPAADGDRNTI